MNYMPESLKNVLKDKFFNDNVNDDQITGKRQGHTLEPHIGIMKKPSIPKK